VFGVARHNSRFLFSQEVERGSDRPEWPTLAIATQCASNRFDIRSVLNREAKYDRGVARIGVALIARLMVVQEHLTEPPSANRLTVAV
jgi:hypothetical protein